VFERVTIHAADLARSGALLAAVIPALGPGVRSHLALVPTASAATATRGLHVGLAAADPAAVEAFWHAGLAAGGRDDGAPGPRPQYRPGYVGAFLLDPDGNSIEAVHHDAAPAVGAVDHVWLRVADLPAARAFYLALAPRAGLVLRHDGRERVTLAARTGGGSLSLICDEQPAAANADLALLVADCGEPDRLLDPDGNRVSLVDR